jgi:hypothetical protein
MEAEAYLLAPLDEGVSFVARPSFPEASVKKVEWVREALSTWPSADYLHQRESAGWRLAAVEWERELDVESPAAGEVGEEIPYGTRIANDCLHLEENPTETQVLNLLAEMIVQDHSYKHMADVLNERAFRTREGKPWTALAVFKLTPRLIEVAPRILSGAEWENRKKQLSRVAWNS